MGSEYTTLRVKKTTRDLINKIATDRMVPVDDLLNLLTKTTKDDIKQILLDVDRDKYYMMRDLAHTLYRMKLISRPEVKDAVLLAIDNMAEGMERSLQAAQGQAVHADIAQTPQSTFNYTSSTEVRGQ